MVRDGSTIQLILKLDMDESFKIKCYFNIWHWEQSIMGLKMSKNSRRTMSRVVHFFLLSWCSSYLQSLISVLEKGDSLWWIDHAFKQYSCIFQYFIVFMYFKFTIFSYWYHKTFNWMGKGKRPNKWYDAQVDPNDHWFSSKPLLGIRSICGHTRIWYEL